jgi:hypothetical protein
MTRHDERRRYHRPPCHYRANALFVDPSPVAACTVVDISAGGARIRFATPVTLPPSFVLEIPDLTLRVDAQLIWSCGESHGVRFVWPQRRHR